MNGTQRVTRWLTVHPHEDASIGPPVEAHNIEHSCEQRCRDFDGCQLLLNSDFFASWLAQNIFTVSRLEYMTWLLFRNGRLLSSDTVSVRSGKPLGIGEISLSIFPIERLDVLRIWNFSQI